MTVEKIDLVGGPLCGVLHEIDAQPADAIIDVIYYGGTAKYKIRSDNEQKADYVEG